MSYLPMKLLAFARSMLQFGNSECPVRSTLH